MHPELRRFVFWALVGLSAVACDDGSSGASDAAAPDGGDPDAMPDTPDAMLDAIFDGPDAMPDAMRDDSDAMRDATSDASPDDSGLDGAMDADPPDLGPPGCEPGVELSGPADRLPAGSAGRYVEANDCTLDEGGAWFGGADHTRCFRKGDGSPWRIWNTGCGWTVGDFSPGGPGRQLLLWSGQCDALPPMHRDTRALDTGLIMDGFGQHLPGVRMTYCPDEAPCAPGVEISGAADGVPPDVAGGYSAARCARDEGGAWLGGVDYSRCFHKDDGSDWRIWNTGCGWEIGRIEDRAGWRRYARTYTGICAAMSPDERGPSALTTGLLYAPDGNVLEGLRADHCRTPSGFAPGALVLDESGDRPAGLVGHYVEAGDCAADEGGAWFGGADPTRCFRAADGGSWRIWNTGCGWEIGRRAGPRGAVEWQRTARTYGGLCADLPDWHADRRGLTAFPLVDGFGDVIEGLHLVHTPDPAPCASTDAIVGLVGDSAPAATAGRYVEAVDCTADEGGAWFGAADFTRCFRKDDGSAWRVWNTGCGWEIGRVDPAEGWRRAALTYTGRCDALPPLQLDVRALSTGALYDPFGARIDGLRVDRCTDRAWVWGD